MGVSLQVISGVLLILIACSWADERQWRQIREAPPPNVTEINNLDLNKILKGNPKTENFEIKSPKQSASNFGFPPKLGKDHYSSAASSESFQNDSRPDWEHKITISYEAEHFQGTRHPSFDSNSELTTPTTKRFDEKFKEAVKNLGFDDDEGIHEEDDEDDEDEDERVHEDEEKNGHEQTEFEKIKSIVDNETASKNSIHKDLSIEETMKINYKNVYNKTEAYDQEIIERNGTTERINKGSSSTTEAAVATTTQEATIHPVIDNNIVSESVASVKNISKPVAATTSSTTTTTTSTSTTTVKTTTNPTTIAKTATNLTTTVKTTTIPTTTVKTTTIPTTTVKTTTIPTTTVKTTTIPTTTVKTTTNPTTTVKTATNPPTTTEATSSTVSLEENIIVSSVTPIKKTHSLPQKVSTTTSTTTTTTTAAPTTTEEVCTTTNTPESGETTTLPPQTTETEKITTIIETTEQELPTSSESIARTSKSLEKSIVSEQTIRDTSTKNVEVEERDGFPDELPTTTIATIGDEGTNTSNTIKKVTDATTTTTTTTTEAVHVVANVEEVTTIRPVNKSQTKEAATEEITTEELTTERRTNANLTTPTPFVTTSTSEATQTTKEFTFVHIEGSDNKHTTFLPDALDPSLNYSTAKSSDEPLVVRMISTSSEAARASSTVKAPKIDEAPNLMETTTDGANIASTEHGDYITRDESGDGSNKGKIAAIVISCVGAVCLVLLAGLLYVMKKRQKRLKYGPRCRPVSLDNLSVYNSVRRKTGARMSKRSFGNPAFEDPVAPSHPLNFPALAKFSANFEDIKAEFEDVPQITAMTSELPEGCDAKNRYANVIPLPETRVFLSPIDGYPNSDYINASYVTGPNNTKGYYIATQGPMQNTVDDFWRMIWEQHAKVILMLTHLVENGLEKCVDYLPESEVLECSRLFGDFQVTLKKREVKDKYIISSLQLKNMVSNSWREVTHFWYLGWPEKGVPSEANSLIAFIIEARSYMKNATLDSKRSSNGLRNAVVQGDHNPVVVHCSPGTGRTGVVIACDIAIREFEKTRLVDIPKIVYKIRRDRANAVQTKEQYIFIYKVVNLYATKLTGGALDNL